MTTRQVPDAEARAESLKERIYVTFTSLAVLLTLQTHASETTTGAAALTLLIAVVGTLLAVFVADLLSHLTVHAKLPTASELRHMVGVSIGSIGVVVLPMVFLGLARIEVWSIETALLAAVAVQLATLAFVGFLAVRRIALPAWQKLMVLLAEVVLGLAVIGLELLAHR